MLCAQRMRSADYLIILMTRLFHQFIFSSLIAWAYSKLTMPGFIGLKLRKSGSGSMRHHFQTWIGHHRAQSQTLTPLRIFGMCWRRLCEAVRLSHHLPSWRKMYATLDGNKCCDIAEAYRNDATVNGCSTIGNVVQQNIIVCDVFLDGQCIYGRKSTKYLHGTWSLLNILINRKIDNFEKYNLFLVIATNIPMLLKTVFVVQVHILSSTSFSICFVITGINYILKCLHITLTLYKKIYIHHSPLKEQFLWIFVLSSDRGMFCIWKQYSR